MDFAVFAVKLGWTKKDYLSITPVERRFILKEIERETVSQSELIKAAVELAISNAYRKRGQAYLKLWKKLSAEVEQPIPEHEIEGLKAAFAAMAH